MENSQEESLLNFLETISWLDDKRWSDTSDWGFIEVTKGMNPEKAILIHWLTYIHDRVKNAEKLWGKTGKSVRKLVEDYHAKADREEKVNEICEKYEDEIGGFPSDRESVRRTLKILLDYDKSLIEFIKSNLKFWSKNYPEEIGTRLAFSLHLLSYRNVQKYSKRKEDRVKNQDKLEKEKEKAKSILSDREEFEETVEKIQHKRVWAALRDLRKNPYLKKKVKKSLPPEFRKIWEERFELNQLELPGDRWNELFHKYAVEPIASDAGLDISSSAFRSTRKIYEKYVSRKGERDEEPLFYPEQMDISFEFAPRMCNKNSKEVCQNICVFGESGGENLCSPGTDVCPVVYVSIGKISECNTKLCPIHKGKSKSICDGIQNKYS